jgi:hypothetical protein
MKSKAEIVVETLKFYNSNNRGYNAVDEHCTYLDKDSGNKCAVGRCILDSEIEKVHEYEQKYIKDTEGSPSVTKLAGYFYFDSLLIPEYRGHSLQFWSDLQYLHDTAINWTEDGFKADEGNFNYISSVFGEEVAEAVRVAFVK